MIPHLTNSTTIENETIIVLLCKVECITHLITRGSMNRYLLNGAGYRRSQAEEILCTEIHLHLTIPYNTDIIIAYEELQHCPNYNNNN